MNTFIMTMNKYYISLLFVSIIFYSCNRNNKQYTVENIVSNNQNIDSNFVKHNQIFQAVLDSCIKKIDSPDSVFYAHYLNYNCERLDALNTIIKDYKNALKNGDYDGIDNMSIYNWFFKLADEKIKESFFVNVTDSTKYLVIKPMYIGGEENIIIFSEDSLYQKIGDIESNVDEIHVFKNKNNKIYLKLYHILKYSEKPYYYEDAYYLYDKDSLKFIRE